MKYIFLLGGMMLFSGTGFSQELKVANERTATADPNNKETPAPENNTEGTFMVRKPIERAMKAEQTLTGTAEGNGQVNSTGSQVAAPMERTANQGSNAVPANSGTKKPD